MKGSAHGRAKLTEADVRWIREHYTPGNKGGRPELTESSTSSPGIGKRFGISPRQVLRIVRGENWGHV